MVNICGRSKMPDVSMCEGTNCSNKESCYRFTAKPNPYRQAYFIQIPLKLDGTCDYFMRNAEWQERGQC